MLYDDIPLPKKGDKAPGSSQPGVSANLSVAPPQLLRPSASAAMVPRSSSRFGRVAPTSIANNPTSELSNNSRAVESQRASTEMVGDHQLVLAALSALMPQGSDSYDPLRPNEYALVKSLLVSARATSEATPKRARTSAAGEVQSGTRATERGESDVSSSSSESGAEPEVRNFPGTRAAASPSSCSHINPAVSGMMRKMGYVAGKGLGVGMQGRVDPVLAVGNDGRGGLGKAAPLVPAVRENEGGEQGTVRMVKNRSQARRVDRRRASSRVLLVQNLPSIPRELISSELNESCSAFGSVEDIVVAEDERQSDQHPRCFVAFCDGPAAASALLALDGSEYHGSELRVSMYSENLFATISGKVSQRWLAQGSGSRAVTHWDE